MTSAAAIKNDILENIENDNSSAKLTAPTVHVTSSVDLGQASFSFTESLAPQQHGTNPLAVILSEDVLRMWLGSDDNHISISRSNGATNIRVINEQTGSAQLTDILSLDEAPKSIAVSPKGNNFLIVLPGQGGVFEYTVSPKGELKATFGFTPEAGQEIKHARYDDQQGIKISTRKI